MHYRLHAQGVVPGAVNFIIRQREPRKLLVGDVVDKVFDTLLETQWHYE